jgi:hypothetical protein
MSSVRTQRVRQITVKRYAKYRSKLQLKGHIIATGKGSPAYRPISTPAAIDEPLRATLLMLGKLTREHAVDADDMRAVVATGASRQQIDNVLAVCFSFNVIGRLADAFGFFVPGPEAFEAGAKYLLARGYR